jgi:hypothetical protein
MTIRAVLRDGVIQPVEPLPPDWTNGQELIVEEPKRDPADEEINQWARDLDAAAARIPAEEHERFLEALEHIERESKDAVRKQWGQP